MQCDTAVIHNHKRNYLFAILTDKVHDDMFRPRLRHILVVSWHDVLSDDLLMSINICIEGNKQPVCNKGVAVYYLISKCQN
jgi:hypothetical protein